MLGRGGGNLDLADVGGVTWDRILHQRCVSDCFCIRSVRPAMKIAHSKVRLQGFGKEMKRAFLPTREVERFIDS